MPLAPLSSAAALLPALPAFGQPPPGCAGQETRESKALSGEEQAELLAGRGMGLARAAELNHHPGPAHVLQLRDKLGLTPDQVEAVQASFQRIEAATKPLGAGLVGREREMDTAFRQDRMTPARLAADMEAIGTLQERLRAVLLAAHPEMRALLTPQQVAAYDALRGCADGTPTAVHGRHPQPG